MVLMPWRIFTEIEAIKEFANVEVQQIASGGINGAEGAVSLSVRGTQSELMKVREVLERVYGEKDFYSDRN